MLKATTSYNPRLNPERSKQRRNVVLGQMAKYEYLSPEQADSLKALPLELKYKFETHNDGLAPYFREGLRRELAAWCAKTEKEDATPYNLYTDGLKIYTTIDSRVQAHAERAVARRMASLQKVFDAHWGNRDPWGKDNNVLLMAMRQTNRYKQLTAEGKSEEEILEEFRKTRPMEVFTWKGPVKKTMSPWDSLRYYQRFLNTGLIAMEPRTGYVRAWVGGINHRFFQYDHVRARRQVGSTFKPIVYAAALEKGIEPCTYFPNTRMTYPSTKTGRRATRRAVRRRILDARRLGALRQHGVGADHAANGHRRNGVAGPRPGHPQRTAAGAGPSLGAANASLLEMTGAYLAFREQRLPHPPVYVTSVVDRDGKVLRRHEPKAGRRQVLSYANADVMIALLQGVVEEGSAARLRSDFGLTMDLAGKTGTTQNHADGWFIGITPGLVAGVWVGAENPAVHFRTLALGKGAATALPIWGEFMGRLGRDRAFRSWTTATSARCPNTCRNASPANRSSTIRRWWKRTRLGIEGFFERLFGHRDKTSSGPRPNANARRLSRRAGRKKAKARKKNGNARPKNAAPKRTQTRRTPPEREDN
jgi:penicillin-binding protein 1A